MIGDLFQLWGTLGVRTKEAYRDIDKFMRRVDEAADRMKRMRGGELGFEDTSAGGFNSFMGHMNMFERYMRSYQNRMNKYFASITPEKALTNMTQRLDIVKGAFRQMEESVNNMQVLRNLSQIEGALRRSRREFTMLGYGLTKKERQALEAQMYNVVNMRAERLQDEIAMTKKALAEMRAADNAGKYKEQIAAAEKALKDYEAELANQTAAKKLAEINGYKLTKIFGKDAFVKPIKDQLDRTGAMIEGFFNRDLAYLANKTYTTIDKAAKALVGPQDTLTQQRMKVQQLAAAYTTLGMTITTMVTPVLGIAGLAFGYLGQQYEEANNRFRAQTLMTKEELKDYKKEMSDIYVDTGDSREEIAKTFSYLKNELGATKEEIGKMGAIGHEFADAWGQGDSKTAIQSIEGIRSAMKTLKIDEEQAADAFALAMKKNNGDVVKAKQDIEIYSQYYDRLMKGQKFSDGEIRAMAEKKVNEALSEQTKQYRKLEIEKKRLLTRKANAKSPEELAVIEEAIRNVDGEMDRLQGRLQRTRDDYLNREIRKLKELQEIDASQAYEIMTEDAGAIDAIMQAIRQTGEALLQLFDAITPGITAAAEGFKSMAEAATEFLRNNPGIAKFVGYIVFLGPAFVILLGLLMPVAGFLIQFRTLFQALGQSIFALGKGAHVVMNPMARMMMERMAMIRAAILGLPRVLAGVIPALLTMLRALPGTLIGMAVQFVKLNPLLSMFTFLAWVAYKNWDRVGPLLEQIWESLKRIGAAILSAFAGGSGDAMEKFSELMEQVAKVVGDILVITLKVLVPLLEAVADLMESGGGKVVAFGIALWFLGGIFGRILPSIRLFGSTVSGIGKSFSWIGKATKSLLGFFNVFSQGKTAATGLASAFGVIGKVFSGLFSWIGRLGGGFRGLGLLGRGAASMIGGPWGIAAWLIVEGIMLIIEHWDKLKQAFSTGWEIVTQVFSAIGRDVAEGFKQGIGPGFEAILKWVGRFFEGLIILVKGIFGIASPSRVMMGIGNDIMTGLLNGLKSLSQGVLSFFNTIAAWILSVWQRIKAATGSSWSSIRSTVVSIAQSIWSRIRSIFTSLYNTIRSIFTRIKTTALSIMRSLRAGIASLAEGVKNAIVNPLKKAWSFISSLPGKALKAGRDIISNLISGIKSLKIPMPHFSFSKGNIMAGVMPSMAVNWYKTGGVFGAPSIIGVGEEPGVQEAVLPLKDSVLGRIGAGIARNMQGGTGGGIFIQNATFPIRLDKLPTTEEEIKKFRDLTQTLVADDLFNRAVRKM